jgi:cell division protein FtsB
MKSMERRKKYYYLDKLLKEMLSKSMYENPVCKLDKIAFTKDLTPEEQIELQSQLIEDNFVIRIPDSSIKLLPLKINDIGASFISKGGYLALLQKENKEKLKSRIILIGVLFSILFGISSTTISVLNYLQTTNNQNQKIEKLKAEIDSYSIELVKIKTQMEKKELNPAELAGKHKVE